METTTLTPTIDGYKSLPLIEDEINLNWPERYISIALGVKLGISGFKNIFKSPFTSILKLGAGGYLINRGISGHCNLYEISGKSTQQPVDVLIQSSYAINKPRQEVYNFWRQLDNLPMFMNHLESVEVIDDTRSRWILKLPAGISTVSWDAEIVNDTPGELIGWSSLPGSIIDNAGKVSFSDSDHGTGTIVDVAISYRPPAGGLGASVAHILNPVFKSMVDKDVQNFKQYMDIDNSLKPLNNNVS